MSTTYSGADSYPASITIPEDAVDDEDAASVNVAFEGLADRATWLKNRTGLWFPYDLRANEVHSGGGGPLASTAAAAFNSTAGAGDYRLDTAAVTTLALDIVQVQVQTQIEMGTLAAPAEFRLAYQIGTGSLVGFPGSSAFFDSLPTDTQTLALVGYLIVPTGGGALHVWLQSRSNGGVYLVSFTWPLNFLATFWRLS